MITKRVGSSRMRHGARSAFRRCAASGAAAVLLGLQGCLAPERESGGLESVPRSRFVEVLGARMHYLELGTGTPILLLHGQPTSAYLWRRVMPGLSGAGRVVALDLIGFGRSERPDIAYEAEDHARYLEAFIDELGLGGMVIVGHDWGSYLGSQYAMEHPDRVRGLVFMEAIFAAAGGLTATPGGGALERRAAEAVSIIRDAARADSLGLREQIYRDNVFVERFLPLGTMRRLSEEEMDAYRAPFTDPATRLPVERWPRQVARPETRRVIGAYSEALGESEIPKLLFTVEPGVLVPASVADWARRTLPRLTVVELGLGLHFVQEDYPEEIARAVAGWMAAERLVAAGPTTASGR